MYGNMTSVYTFISRRSGPYISVQSGYIYIYMYIYIMSYCCSTYVAHTQLEQEISTKTTKACMIPWGGILFFLFFCFSLPNNVYVVPIVSSTMTWHCIACSAYVPHNNEFIASLWRSFCDRRTCISLGLKNRHGHWLCWISTGRKNGSM